jgi:predicted RNase H-like HicB family nuclease
MFKKVFLIDKVNIQHETPEAVLGVVFSQGEDGYIIAECPQLPGCMSQGKTRDEARKNIVDAMEAVITVRLAHLLAEAASRRVKCVGSPEKECFRVKGPELVSV